MPRPRPNRHPWRCCPCCPSPRPRSRAATSRRRIGRLWAYRLRGAHTRERRRSLAPSGRKVVMEHLVTLLRAQWDRILGVGLVLAGAMLLLAGWFGVSGASTTKDQLSYLASGGLGGLFCLGAGIGLLISANLADEWRKLDALTRAVREASVKDPSVSSAEGVADVSVDSFSDKQLTS